MTAINATTQSKRDCPYNGLSPYASADSGLFFGRKGETSVLVANLMASRLVLLYGETGVGKSSLVRAGLAAHLQRLAAANIARGRNPRFIVAVYPPDPDPDPKVSQPSWRDDPVQGLHAAIAKEVARLELPHQPPDVEIHLDAVLEAWSRTLDSDLFLVLDQFEEYLLYHDDEAKPEGSLGAELPRALARSDLRASFLVSIREDALAKLDRFRVEIPNLFDNYLRVNPLGPMEAAEAIRLPLEHWKSEIVTIEDKLVNAVLRDASRVELGPGGVGTVDPSQDRPIDTVVLQLVMERLWQKDHAAGTLRFDSLEELGGAIRIVRDHLDASMNTLASEEQRIAARIFRYLVTPSGTKFAHTASDLAKTEKLELSSLEPVLDRLVVARILRQVAPPPPPARPREPRYEIFHDALADAVLDWRTRWLQREAEANAKAEAAAQRQREREEAERQRHQEREKAAEQLRRRQHLLWIAVAAAVVFLFLAAGAGYEWHQARVNQHHASVSQKAAEAEALAADAAAALGTHPAVAADRAVRSIEKEPTKRALKTLRIALGQPRLRESIELPAPVESVAYGRNGSFAVASGPTIRVWKASALNARTPMLVIRGGKDAVLKNVTFDGPRYIGARDGGRLRIWNLRTGRAVRIRGSESSLRSFSFDPTNENVVAGTDGLFTQIWNWRRGTMLAKPIGLIPAALPFTGAAIFTTTVAFSPDGKTLALGRTGNPNSVGLWRVDCRYCAVMGLKGRTGPVQSLAFSHDGRKLVTSDGRTARVWNVDTRREAAVLTGHRGSVNDAAFDPSGTLLVTGSSDGSARVWSWRSRTPVVVLHHSDEVQAVAFSPTGGMIATGALDGAARIWTVDLGRSIGGGDGPVLDARYSHSGRYFVTAAANGKVRIWANDGTARRVLTEQARVRRAVFSSDDNELLTTPELGPVEVWNWREPNKPPLALGTQESTFTDADLASGSDGKLRVVTVADDGQTLLWRVDPSLTSATRRVLRHGRPTFDVYAAGFSPDGERVAVTAPGRKVLVWDTACAESRGTDCPSTIVGLRHDRYGQVKAIAFSPAGRRLATANGPIVRIWDLDHPTGALHVLRGPSLGVESVAFSSDGHLVAAGSGDETTTVWDARSGDLRAVLHVHGDLVESVAFKPNTHDLLSSSDDGFARAYPCRTCTDDVHELVERARSQRLRTLNLRGGS